MRFALTRVGVLLAGCGTHDGTDVAEATLTLLALERAGVKPYPLAAAGDQMHVVDHASCLETTDPPRAMVTEAARLTRGQVETLGEKPPERLHALIIPGGGGVLKNLTTGFLEKGVRRELIPSVRHLVSHCLDAGKPVGVIGLANFLLDGLVDSPVLPAHAGAHPEPLVVDAGRRLVYAPGSLTAATMAELALAIEGLVELILHYVAEARQPAGESP